MKNIKNIYSLLFLINITIYSNAYAQNHSWEKYGFDPKVITLSNGKYQEFHDLKIVVEIGSVLYNAETKKIVGFTEEDTLKENGLKPHIISRWMCPDPLAEEYSSWSPYNYVANNPIIFIDPNGKEISFSYQYEKDKKGKDIVDENGNKKLIGITMHITGKIIDVSEDGGVDMNTALADIVSRLESSFQGEVDGISFKTEANLSIAKSMDDISESDHIFALADISKYDGKTVNGVVSDYGGKVAFIDADYFRGPWDKNVGNTGERTAAHEFGHLGNLYHGGNYFNVMKQGAGNLFFSMSTAVSSEQLKKIHTSYKLGLLNKGYNSENTPIYNFSKGWSYKKMPNRGKGSSIINY